MANEEQVRLLKERGVKAWNKWREAESLTKPDLSSAQLHGLNLDHVNFDYTILVRADLSGTHLMEASLTGAILEKADLHHADLIRANLTCAELPMANLVYANLHKANLSWANLAGVNLSRAEVSHACLEDAELSEADFSLADCIGTNLRWAQVRSTKFHRTTLASADFYCCKMFDAQFGSVDLSGCLNLEMVEHLGPSTIGIDTISLSGGNIPDAFLRGAGVPEPFIVHMKSLVAAMKPIEFYSCFISYSSKDQEFAERLRSDLQSNNVRCWFAPEDLKIGEKLRSAFDEAIRVHDKLMVLLSEQSVKSPWVEKEVETAFEKERQEKRTVLFPIRLDDAVINTARRGQQTYAGQDISATFAIGKTTTPIRKRSSGCCGT